MKPWDRFGVCVERSQKEVEQVMSGFNCDESSTIGGNSFLKFFFVMITILLTGH